MSAFERSAPLCSALVGALPTNQSIDQFADTLLHYYVKLQHLCKNQKTRVHHCLSVSSLSLSLSLSLAVSGCLSSSGWPLCSGLQRKSSKLTTCSCGSIKTERIDVSARVVVVVPCQKGDAFENTSGCAGPLFFYLVAYESISRFMLEINQVAQTNKSKSLGTVRLVVLHSLCLATSQLTIL